MANKDDNRTFPQTDFNMVIEVESEIKNLFNKILKDSITEFSKRYMNIIVSTKSKQK